MNTKKKIICLALVLLMFGGVYLLPIALNTGQNIYVSEEVEPNNRFVTAAASALDAVGANENNLTMTDGTPIDNHGDDLLAGNYEEYVICINASDADGYGDIDVISASLVTGAGANFTTFIWTRTGANTVTESTGSTLVVLGTWVNVTGANDVDIEIPFSIEWDCGTQTDLDLNITLDEAGTPVATRQVNLNVDVVATLGMSDSTMFTYNDYLNGAAFGTIGVTYHYAGYTTLYPLDAETDFHVSMAAVPAEGISARTWVSTAYDQSTGIASFNDIVAPDTNTRQQLTFTMLSVDNGDGATGTNLATVATYTDTVWVDPAAPYHPPEDGGGIIPVIDFLQTPEGVLISLGAIIVVGGGTYLYFERGSTPTRKRRTQRRKKTRRKKRK